MSFLMSSEELNDMLQMAINRFKIRIIHFFMLSNIHSGARPPPVCAHRVWVDFFQNGTEKVCKGLWVSPYWILALKRLTLTQFCRNLVRAMQIWRPFANFYLSVDIYQG